MNIKVVQNVQIVTKEEKPVQKLEELEELEESHSMCKESSSFKYWRRHPALLHSCWQEP